MRRQKLPHSCLPSEAGERRYMVLHYFLADDTIEIREVQQTNSGRDGPGIFLKRQKLPRAGSSLVHPPGSVTSRTLLNVFAKSGTNLCPGLRMA